MTVDFNYSYQISASTPAVASEVQQNFNELLEWIKVNYFQVDATPPLTQIPVSPGDPTIPSHFATKSYVDAVLPTGIVIEYGGDTAPDGYLLCDGGTYSTTGTYADLFAVIGYKYGGSGGSFNVPDRRARVAIGAGRLNGTDGTDFAVGGLGGEQNSVLPEHNHDIGHGHTASATGGSHNHTASSVATGLHDHGNQLLMAGKSDGFTNATEASNLGGNRAGDVNVTIPDEGSHSHTITVNTDTTHAHTISVVSHTGNSGNEGAGTTLVDKNFQPFVVSNVIIKL